MKPMQKQTLKRGFSENTKCQFLGGPSNSNLDDKLDGASLSDHSRYPVEKLVRIRIFEISV